MNGNGGPPETPGGTRFRTDILDDESATIAVARAVSSVKGVKPTEMPPLYNHVDPEALNTIANNPQATVKLSVSGLDVVVGDDEIAVYT